ncbi:MAG TPA: phosphate signaling complex protein PhoU [Mycobacteriales bacterium]|jgi:phosphate transport system protein|nr:phosphate signaling complex protein PhoU [Mycobacteriales bacterium]
MRETFHGELDQIGRTLVEMSQAVAVAMRDATTALLDADLTTAEKVISEDAHVDKLRDDLEARAFDLLARQQPVAIDLRTVITSLKAVADLERMGDLALHVAKVARMRYPAAAVPDDVRGTIREMGDIALSIVDKTTQVLEGQDIELAEQLEREDDAMDALHRRLFTALLEDDWAHGMEPAIDITLIGRYYERYADHAVSVARQVIFLVTGEPAPLPSSITSGATETALGA